MAGVDVLAQAFANLVDALAVAWAEPINALAAAIRPVTIVESDLLTPGTVIREGHRVYTHPLDACHLRHPDEPFAAHDEAIAWILARANRRADAAIALLDAALENRS